MKNSNHLDFANSLKGKVALVTGGYGGIGYECVNQLIVHGARVIFTYVEGRKGESIAKKIVQENPNNLFTLPLDLQSYKSISKCIDNALNHWGKLDILINNAGVGSATVSSFAESNEAQDTAMININADGTLKMCQKYIEVMNKNNQKNTLKIINLSSVGGGISIFPNFRLSDGMSKAAIAFLTKQLAAETTDKNIDVFAICPGATNTKMFQESMLNKMSDAELKNFKSTLPKQRLIEPVEIARIILFLASDYSTPLHGAILDASMGLGVRPGLMSEYNFIDNDS